MAFFVDQRKRAASCQLEQTKAQHTQNTRIRTKDEHFKHWTAWSSNTIEQLKQQKAEKSADGSGERDRK